MKHIPFLAKSISTGNTGFGARLSLLSLVPLSARSYTIRCYTQALTAFLTNRVCFYLASLYIFLTSLTTVAQELATGCSKPGKTK